VISKDISSHCISVILPVYNGAESLESAIKSILQQSYADFEFIIIDDGSTDNSISVIRQFEDHRIKVILNDENRGLPFRLNQAIDLSRGKYIARMDADDIAFPERLETQLHYMKMNPEIDLVGSAMVVFGNGGQAIGKYEVPESHDEICRRQWAGFYLPHPTWFARKSFFEKYRYNINAYKSQDQELLLRAFSESRFANVPDVLLGYRQEKLSIRRSIVSRYIFSKAIASYFFETNEYYKLIRGISGQILKATADILVIGTGLGRLLYVHRANPAGLDANLLKRWKAILADLDAN
jgi:glycosyltransferase involved in cell wall biosynthesis